MDRAAGEVDDEVVAKGGDVGVCAAGAVEETGVGVLAEGVDVGLDDLRLVVGALKLGERC